MAVVDGRIGAVIGQKVLFRDLSRGSEQNRPFCILFVCFLIYLLLGGLFKVEFAPWRPHRVSQL
jgi:hypothetical protein